MWEYLFFLSSKIVESRSLCLWKFLQQRSESYNLHWIYGHCLLYSAVSFHGGNGRMPRFRRSFVVFQGSCLFLWIVMIICLDIAVVKCRHEPLVLVFLLGRNFFPSPHPPDLWMWLMAVVGMRTSFNLKIQAEEKVSSYWMIHCSS